LNPKQAAQQLMATRRSTSNMRDPKDKPVEQLEVASADQQLNAHPSPQRPQMSAVIKLYSSSLLGTPNTTTIKTTTTTKTSCTLQQRGF
jgi:hypothetical protein